MVSDLAGVGALLCLKVFVVLFSLMRPNRQSVATGTTLYIALCLKNSSYHSASGVGLGGGRLRIESLRPLPAKSHFCCLVGRKSQESALSHLTLLGYNADPHLDSQ